MKIRFSLRTVAITVTVFCCLLSIFRVTVSSGKSVSGAWIHSRYCSDPKAKPLVGFVREKAADKHVAYYVAVWLYKDINTPLAFVYVSESPVPKVVKSGFHLQTAAAPVTKGWKITLGILAAVVFFWYPIRGLRTVMAGNGVPAIPFVIKLLMTQPVSMVLIDFAFRK